MLYFRYLLYKFWETAWFFDKYAVKNNLQNKMQITLFLVTSNDIDFDHVCHMNMYW